jgi:hypothetical protein
MRAIPLKNSWIWAIRLSQATIHKSQGTMPSVFSMPTEWAYSHGERLRIDLRRAIRRKIHWKEIKQLCRQPFWCRSWAYKIDSSWYQITTRFPEATIPSTSSVSQWACASPTNLLFKFFLWIHRVRQVRTWHVCDLLSLSKTSLKNFCYFSAKFLCASKISNIFTISCNFEENMGQVRSLFQIFQAPILFPPIVLVGTTYVRTQIWSLVKWVPNHNELG